MKSEDGLNVTSSANFLSHGNLSLYVSVSPKILTPNESFTITIRLRNIGNTNVRIISPTRWISSYIEIYSENGSQIKYAGPRPSLLPPTDENLRILHPGEEIVNNYYFSWSIKPVQGGVKDWYFPWEGRYKVVVVYTPNIEYSKITLPYWKKRALKDEDWFEINNQ